MNPVPMVVRPSCRTIDVSPASLNTAPPRVLRDPGRSIDVSEAQFWNDLIPMEVTDAGRITSLREVHPLNVLGSMAVNDVKADKSMVSRLAHWLNAKPLMKVTDGGQSTDFKLAHSTNALCPMISIVSGRMISVSIAL